MNAPNAAARGTNTADIVFLLDVDNTLLDNDAIVADMRRELTADFGEALNIRYWELFEQRRAEVGYADYIGTLQQFRAEIPHEPRLLAMSSFLLGYPFRERLFPGALELVAHLSKWGTPVILTDGDVVFQPLKIERSGLFAAVDGRVLLYVHKEHDLDDVRRRFPARHYVLIDDKPRILAAVKAAWGGLVTTVFPRQGHYATDPDAASYTVPDVTVARIGDLLALDPPPGVARENSTNANTRSAP